MSAKYGLRQEDGPLLPPTPIVVPKRAAWFLDELVKAGGAGVTTINYPGVRVGDCILKLRKAGVDVQTIYEPHDGEFAGRHGRYVLRSRVELLVVPKRAAWFLDELVKAGGAGVTTINYPGVRVGDCILKLRKAGVDVQTIYEPHDGEFAGRHGRYVLRSRVELLPDDDAPSPDPTPMLTHSIGMVAP